MLFQISYVPNESKKIQTRHIFVVIGLLKLIFTMEQLTDTEIIPSFSRMT